MPLFVLSTHSEGYRCIEAFVCFVNSFSCESMRVRCFVNNYFCVFILKQFIMCMHKLCSDVFLVRSKNGTMMCLKNGYPNGIPITESQTRSPRHEVPGTESQARHHRHGIPGTESQARNPRHRIPGTESQARNPRHGILGTESYGILK